MHLLRVAVASIAFGLSSAACAGQGLPAAIISDGPAPATSTTAPPIAPAEAPDGLPDISAADLSTGDLLAMLPAGDTGVAGTESPEMGVRSNEHLIDRTVGSGGDEADDIARFGRITGVTAEYPGALGVAHVWIDLLPDPSSAHSYLVDMTGDISKGLGGTHDPGVVAAAVDDFPVDGLGDEAVGLVADLVSDGATETLIAYRTGPLVVFASLLRRDTADMRVAAQYLAEEVEDGIRTTLEEMATRTGEASALPAYRFAFERVVTWDDDSAVVASEGVVDGGRVSCRVTTDGPGGHIDRELVAIGSHLWFRDGLEGFTPAGSAASEMRGLLAFCPAWPLDIEESGLRRALDDDPDMVVADGGLVTIHEATLADLTAVLGGTTKDVDLATFRFTIVEDTPWLAGVTLIAYGPASQLRSLAGDVDARYVSLTVTHSVSDLGGDDLRVVPPQ